MSYVLITATKNSSSTLHATLDSVRIQANQPLYHVFIDKSSEDSTLDIISEYITTLDSTTGILLNQTSNGIYSAWNQALCAILPLIDGNTFILTLNSDDRLDPSFSMYLDSLSSSNVIAGSCFCYYGDTSCYRSPRSFFFAGAFMPVMDPSFVIKASVYRELGLYNDSFKVAGDYEFFCRILASHITIEVIPVVLTHVLMGGFASQNYRLAAFEALSISRSYFSGFMPELSFLPRYLSFPRSPFLDRL